MLGVGCDAASPSAPARDEPSGAPTIEPSGAPTIEPSVRPAPSTRRPPTEGAPAPVEGRADASSRTASDEPWVGAWASTSCGARAYPRWVTLEADGRLTGQERISPCPPNVACVWSGVVPWKGRWTEEEGTISLTLDAPPSNPAMKPLPATLRWDGTTLLEPPPPPCRYVRR